MLSYYHQYLLGRWDGTGGETGETMSDVIRVFVEKKPGFDVEAQHMKADLVENLGMPVEDLKLLNRYDISGLSREEFEAARGTIFSEPNVDTVYDEEYPLPEDIRSLPWNTCPDSMTSALILRLSAYSC